MNSTVAETLDRLIREKHLSEGRLAKLSGVPQPTINRIRNGQHRDPKNETLAALAKALKVPLSDLRGDAPSVRDEGGAYDFEFEMGSVTSLRVPEPFPVVSREAAVRWMEMSEDERRDETRGDSWGPLENAGKDAFVVVHVGDSMLPQYPPGVLLFVDPERRPGPGDDVLVAFDGSTEPGLRRYVVEAGKVYLRALNPAAAPEPFLPIAQGVTVIGVVIHFSANAIKKREL